MKTKQIILLLIIVAAAVGAILLLRNKHMVTPVVVQQKKTFCFTRTHNATKDAPYTVNEHITLVIDGTSVTGTKRGTQSGPDMTNGYEGTLTGTMQKNIITSVFAYTVEGSYNQEKEIYRVKEDQTGIEKLRYPLIERVGILVPDPSKEFTVELYSRVGCDASN